MVAARGVLAVSLLPVEAFHECHEHHAREISPALPAKNRAEDKRTNDSWPPRCDLMGRT